MSRKSSFETLQLHSGYDPALVRLSVSLEAPRASEV
jgi:hypothetical protein